MSNQASEDELKAIIERYVDRTAVLAEQDCRNFNNKHLLKLDMGTAIETIIRTEKLKLLDEVRERVIGEDLPPDVATDSGIGYSRQQFAINMGKAGQRTVLTKMEAEL